MKGANMRLLLSLVILTLSPLGFAEENVANTTSKHALLVSGGYTSGGFALGVDYENNFHRTYGIGGFLRMYGDNDDNGQGEITAFGAFIRPHFTRQAWDFFISPGVAFFQEEYNPPGPATQDDESMIGPVLMIGLLYQLNYDVAVGVEHMSIYGWFGEDALLGIRSDELLAKFRYSF
jgi:hypothetical protein